MLPRRADSTRPIPHERRGRRSASGTMPAIRGGPLAERTILVVFERSDARDALTMHLAAAGASAVGVAGTGAALAALEAIQLDAIVGELAPELLARLDARAAWAVIPRVIASCAPEADALARATATDLVATPQEHDRVADALVAALARAR